MISLYPFLSISPARQTAFPNWSKFESLPANAGEFALILEDKLPVRSLFKLI